MELMKPYDALLAAATGAAQPESLISLPAGRYGRHATASLRGSREIARFVQFALQTLTAEQIEAAAEYAMSDRA